MVEPYNSVLTTDTGNKFSPITDIQFYCVDNILVKLEDYYQMMNHVDSMNNVELETLMTKEETSCYC